MEIGSELMGDIGIVRYSGTLLGEPADSKKSEQLIKELLQNGVSQLLLDLKNVLRINSTGLAILITASTLFQQKGGKVILTGCNDFIKGALTVTKLEQFFQYFDELDEALQELNKKE